MIDLKHLREHPEHYKLGAARKGSGVDIDRLLALDTQKRQSMTEMETLRAQQRVIEKEAGPQIGKLAGAIKKAEGAEKAKLEAEVEALKAKPAALKEETSQLEAVVSRLEPEVNEILLTIPQPSPSSPSASARSRPTRWWAGCARSSPRGPAPTCT